MANFSQQHADQFKKIADLKAFFSKRTSNTVDLKKLFYNESRNVADAHNTSGGGFGAIGLGQIRKPALEEWNRAHPDQQYGEQDLYHIEPNYNIASWYVNNRIPQELRHYGVQDTEMNRVAAYNAGSRNVAMGHIPYDYLHGYATAMEDQNNSGQTPMVGR